MSNLTNDQTKTSETIRSQQLDEWLVGRGDTDVLLEALCSDIAHHQAWKGCR